MKLANRNITEKTLLARHFRFFRRNMILSVKTFGYRQSAWWFRSQYTYVLSTSFQVHLDFRSRSQ